MNRLLMIAVILTAGCAGEPRDDRGDHEKSDDHSGHKDEEHTVTIDAKAIKRMGIVVDKVGAAPSAGGIDVPAELRAIPDKQAHISSVVSGQIAAVHASIGDHVKAGQALAVIRSIALGSARAKAARARADVSVAQANFDRQQELHKEGIGAKRQFLEAEAQLRRAQAELAAASRALDVYGRGGRGSEIVIRSPIDGRVVKRHATVGEVVHPSDRLFEITDISRVWAIGQVYQQQAGQVSEGAKASLSLQALPGRTISGTISYVSPTLDERTRTLPVRMALSNEDGTLRPGLFGTLSIAPAGTTAKNIAVVDDRAIQRVGDQMVLFVPGDKPGEFRATAIAVQSRSHGVALVHSGIAIGASYVSEGAFVLKSELERNELGEGHVH